MPTPGHSSDMPTPGHSSDMATPGHQPQLATIMAYAQPDPVELLREREAMQDDSMSESSMGSLEELDIQGVREEEVSNVDKFKTMSEMAEQKLIRETLQKKETRQERLDRLQVSEQVNNMTIDQLDQCGVIQAICEDSLVIKGQSTLILDLQNTVFVQVGEGLVDVLGIIEDVMGNIEMPFYRVLIDQFMLGLIGQGSIQVGQAVLIKQNNSKILNMQDIQTKLAQKGCDASNRFDEEVHNQNERDFSDDEFDRRSHHSHLTHHSQHSSRPTLNKKQQKILNKNQSRHQDMSMNNAMPIYNQFPYQMSSQSFPQSYPQPFPPQPYIQPPMFFPQQPGQPMFPMAMPQPPQHSMHQQPQQLPQQPDQSPQQSFQSHPLPQYPPQPPQQPQYHPQQPQYPHQHPQYPPQQPQYPPQQPQFPPQQPQQPQFPPQQPQYPSQPPQFVSPHPPVKPQMFSSEQPDS